MADFTSYTTRQGDTWDNIAYLAYGDSFSMQRILDANPQVAILDELPAGITLNIPIVPEPTLDTELLPPWKR